MATNSISSVNDLIEQSEQLRKYRQSLAGSEDSIAAINQQAQKKKSRCEAIAAVGIILLFVMAGAVTMIEIGMTLISKSFVESLMNWLLGAAALMGAWVLMKWVSDRLDYYEDLAKYTSEVTSLHQCEEFLNLKRRSPEVAQYIAEVVQHRKLYQLDLQACSEFWALHERIEFNRTIEQTHKAIYADLYAEKLTASA